MGEKRFYITESDRTNLLAYLYGRPYWEIAKGVRMLEELREVPADFVKPPVLAEVKEQG